MGSTNRVPNRMPRCEIADEAHVVDPPPPTPSIREAMVKHAWPGSAQPCAGETTHTTDQFRISGLDDAALEAMLEALCKFAFVSVRLSPSADSPGIPSPRISSSLRCGFGDAARITGNYGSGGSFKRPFLPGASLGVRLCPPLFPSRTVSQRGAEERAGA